MEYHLKSRQEVEDFIRREVLTTNEAAELLGVKRARISQLINSGKLIPIKKLSGTSLFLRTDIVVKKKELEASRKKFRPYDED
ncbi:MULTISPECIES: helix-turn-helix domain-containing protein [Bacillus subtilis group]|uniref:helix-turn-helix domain-containing protein n=1 Tax=Bacillus subtilis group TaxID=653685 RepID=UPI002A6A98C5|nr:MULTISPECIES: helix-turn-helix domain-containing protein [Bacillus subtilis group]MEC1663023.1 helix-turn-helix domain-containing protein [Bacillus halotolerans]WPP26282.1 helix-turn-helix domain-containing protein [Bacillus subtilis]